MAKASKMNPGSAVEKVKAPVNPWDGHMGTKTSMLISVISDEDKKNCDITNAVNFQKNCIDKRQLVLARDERGLYWTTNVDTGLLDPYRMYVKR